ncbi:hypothetical protein Raf01_36650 [Rugosimonospora africana]|uniref:Uncharacterized protein n=1 Tax=Rugosimonospora africana TaxID=556532 RepID=A0A8J3VRK8_9ACTN|nr:hypothetical protein Raf01_36650 [Rugosimonospora africana]
MLALAFLTMLAAATAPPVNPDRHYPARSSAPVPLTTAEIRRLFTALFTTPLQEMSHLLSWSCWRRSATRPRARQAHYQRRLTASTG